MDNPLRVFLLKQEENKYMHAHTRKNALYHRESLISFDNILEEDKARHRTLK